MVWVGTYLALGLPVSAAIPFAYQVASVVTLLAFARTKDYCFFRFSQIVLILLLPFLLQWSLGGYVASSAVSVWALVGVFGALFFFSPRQAVPWFALLVAGGRRTDPGDGGDVPAAQGPVPLRGSRRDRDQGQGQSSGLSLGRSRLPVGGSPIETPGLEWAKVAEDPDAYQPLPSTAVREIRPEIVLVHRQGGGAWFADRQVEEFRWLICPSATPRGITGMLVATGAAQDESEPNLTAMVLDHEPPPEIGVRTGRVVSFANFEAMERIREEVFGTPDHL